MQLQKLQLTSQASKALFTQRLYISPVTAMICLHLRFTQNGQNVSENGTLRIHKLKWKIGKHHCYVGVCTGENRMLQKQFAWKKMALAVWKERHLIIVLKTVLGQHCLEWKKPVLYEQDEAMIDLRLSDCTIKVWTKLMLHNGTKLNYSVPTKHNKAQWVCQA